MSTAVLASGDPGVERLLLEPLAGLRRRCRAYLVLEGLVRVVVALVGCGLFQLVLDRGLRLSVDQRAFLNVVITLLWLWVVYRGVLIPLIRPIPVQALATAVDRAHPELHDQIATAVQLAAAPPDAGRPESPELVRAVIAEACRVARSLSFREVLNHRRAVSSTGRLAGLVILIAAAFALMPETMQTWFMRNWLVQDLPWPQQTRIVPVGFDATGRKRVPRGDELEIVAEIRGKVPTSSTLSWRGQSGRHGREAMTLVGEQRLKTSLGALVEDVYFRIDGGDEHTREYVVQAVERPTVVRTTVRIVPPGYTGLDPLVLEQATALEVLNGSHVEIEAQINKPVASSHFIGAGVAVPCEVLDENLVRVRLRAGAGPGAGATQAELSAGSSREGTVDAEAPLLSGSYHFALTDHDGWTNTRPVSYTVKVVADNPPQVRLELQAVGEFVTPQARLPIRLRFEDAYGLGSVHLWIQKSDEPPLEEPLDGFQPGRRELLVTREYPASQAGASPGDRLRFWAEAADLDPQGPNQGHSEAILLRVLSPEEFLSEMARREHELRREFERLTSDQRSLREALEKLVPALETLPRPMAAALEQRVGGLARRQDGYAGRCLVMRRRFEQLLAEMQTSQVARAGDERRIVERVAGPLETLGREMMPVASAAIVDVRRAASPFQIEALRVSQEQVLAQMQTILANMLEWEGYREAVALLQQIIADQAEVRSATVEALEERLGAILGLDEALPEPEREPGTPRP